MAWPDFDTLITPADVAHANDAGAAWNAAAKSRPGNPEKEKAPQQQSRWVGTSHEQELREQERDAIREKGTVTDAEVEVFLQRCRKKHAGHWKARPQGSR